MEMEYGIDIDILGEIMIPLENNLVEGVAKGNKGNSFNSPYKNINHNPLSLKLESILDKNFKDFRSILFQGELLRFFVVIKVDKSKDVNLTDLMKSIFIKFEFDSSCDPNELELRKIDETLGGSNPKSVFEDNESSQVLSDLDKINMSDLFSLQRSSYINKFSGNNSNSHYNYQNKNYDFISRRTLLEEKNIIIFEVIRHIIVPNKCLNKNLILKLNIMKKNELEFIKNYSMSDILNSGIYDSVKEFTIIKTLFKEVKIIRPLYISKTRQIDILPDTSLLQIRVENITSSINFIDKNLKTSKFLTGGNVEDVDVLNFGISLVIKEIQVLKEETVVDKKTTINVKSLEQYIKNEAIPLDNVHFTLLNENFPIEIKPGEEVVLMMKVFKSAFIYEKIMTKQEESKQKSSDKSIIATVTLTNSGYTNTTSNQANPRKNSLTSVQTTNTNYQQTQSVYHNYNFNNLINQVQPKKDSSTVNEDGSGFAFVENDEIIKVVLSTPIILNISSFKFYDSLFMSIPIKWHNEITRFLKVEIEIQEDINLHEYFYVNLKAKNISNGSMDLVLEISDSSSDFIQNTPQLDTEIFDYKGKSTDQIPSILSETKIKNIGIINPNEEKLIDLRFLPLKNGFNSLCSFNILDKNTNKKFFVVHTNKIYVREY